jgi:hypothetical protein
MPLVISFKSPLLKKALTQSLPKGEKKPLVISFKSPLLKKALTSILSQWERKKLLISTFKSPLPLGEG